MNENGAKHLPQQRGQGLRFPFRTVLSLKPLIDFWARHTAEEHGVKSFLGRKIRDELSKAPELLHPIEDLSVLEKHRDLVETLMGAVFPAALWEEHAVAVNVPYELQSFYASPFFERLNVFQNGEFKHPSNVNQGGLVWGKTVRAYNAIIKRFYSDVLHFDYPLLTSIPDPRTGLKRHYTVNFDSRFVEIRTRGDIPVLDEQQKSRLLSNLTNLEVLRELLPPEHFEFHGFSVSYVMDVTDQQVLSSLKANLLARDSITSTEKLENLRDELRVLLRAPELLLGVEALRGDLSLFRDVGRKIGGTFVLEGLCRYGCSDTAGSIYESALKRGEFVIVEDMSAAPEPTAIEAEILSRGIRNMVLAPLYDEGELIGLLELGSPNPGDLNPINAIKLGEVLPLFSRAVKRSLDDLDVQVQAVIREQCTAIHPAVEWRFRRAALESIQNTTQGKPADMTPIVLENVFPLYGLSDVRDSSIHRNKATQADLLDLLVTVQDILDTAKRVKFLPILDELSLRLGRRMDEITVGLNSADEERTKEFLAHEFEPLLDLLREWHPNLERKVKDYRASRASEQGPFYGRRGDFQQSLRQINGTISAYLEERQREAQAMFPHYFEKFVTDGVDHSMYIGGAIVEDEKFHSLYLRNLRLWQLTTLCGIARETDKLKNRLPIALETTHLVLVQNSPISLRFDFDEKKFTVDGAYDMRYEIIKKRIDKALIRRTGERLTQPGKIAMVYSQSGEATEYRGYLDLLQSQGHITGDIEELELEDLQGVHGLRALRVTVNLQAAAIDQPRGESGKASLHLVS